MYKFRAFVLLMFVALIPAISPVFGEGKAEHREDHPDPPPSLEKPLSEIIQDIQNPDPDIRDSALSVLEPGVIWDAQQRRLREGVSESEVKELARVVLQLDQNSEEPADYALLLTNLGPYAIEAFPTLLSFLKSEIPKMEQGGGAGYGVVIASGAIAQIGPDIIPLVTEEIDKSDGRLREILLGILQKIQNEQHEEAREGVRSDFGETWERISELVQRFQNPNLTVSKEAARLVEEKWADQVELDPEGRVFLRYALPVVSGQAILLDVYYDWENRELLHTLFSFSEKQNGDYVRVLLSDQKCSVKITGQIQGGSLKRISVERSCPSPEDEEQEIPLIKVKSQKDHEIFFEFAGRNVAIYPAWDPYFASEE